MMISIATLDQNDQLSMIIGIEWDRMGSGPDQDLIRIDQLWCQFFGLSLRVANDTTQSWRGILRGHTSAKIATSK